MYLGGKELPQPFLNKSIFSDQCKEETLIKKGEMNGFILR